MLLANDVSLHCISLVGNLNWSRVSVRRLRDRKDIIAHPVLLMLLLMYEQIIVLVMLKQAALF